MVSNEKNEENPLETVSPPGGQYVQDPKVIAEACRQLKEIAQKDWEEDDYAVKVLCAVCILTEAEPGRTEKGCSPNDIAKAIHSFGVSDWITDEVPGSLPRKVQSQWKRITTKLWPKKETGVAERFASVGLEVTPEWDPSAAELRERKGGRGKKGVYKLRFVETQARPALVGTSGDGNKRTIGERARDDLPDIEYFTENLDTRRLRSWHRGLLMTSWRGRLLRSLIGITGLSLLVFALAVMMFVLFAKDTATILKFSFIAALSVFFLHSLFGWWATLVENNIARVPDLFQSFSNYGNDVFELRRDPKGGPSRLYLARYVANCPVCGKENGRGSVRLGSGRFEFFGRVVGRCRHAPNEHVWSFDHITRRGKSLR